MSHKWGRYCFQYRRWNENTELVVAISGTLLKFLSYTEYSLHTEENLCVCVWGAGMGVCGGHVWVFMHALSWMMWKR